MQILVVLLIVLVAVLVTSAVRNRRDRQELAARVTARGAEVIRIRRAKKGSHPFPETGRGWWAWQVEWLDGTGQHLSWVLTTREGIKEWRD